MVLTHEQAEVTPKGFLEQRDYNSFIVLDATSILYEDEKMNFGYTIEILNVIRITKLINKMCAGFKSSFTIDSSIYYNAISNILEGNPFTGSELERFFLVSKLKEEFISFSRSLAYIEDDFYFPYEVDFMLLGVDINIHDALDETVKGELHDRYGDLKCIMNCGEIEIKDFISQAQKMFIDAGVINITTE
jgi:hypothetical protein